MEIQYRTHIIPPLAEVIDLYDGVGWDFHAHQEQNLAKALSNSNFLVSAWHNKNLVGLCRCISDNVSVCHFHGLAVKPEFQRNGIGRELLRLCLERFAHVEIKVILTNIHDNEVAFYESLGFKEITKAEQVSVHVFLLMN